MTRRLWIMLLCGVLVVLIGNGLRLTFGVFLRPISFELEIGRETFGLVIATQALLQGIFQPIAGILADRYGALRVIAVGSLVYGLGLWLTSLATSALGLYLALGFMVGLGLSCTTNVIVLGAIGRVVPNERRGIVFGTVIAAGSLGMFFFVPGAQHLLDITGWRETFIIAAFLIALAPLLALGLRVPAEHADRGQVQPFGDAANEAWRHRSYVLLTLGFFVCGFHVSFIGTHLPAYLSDSDVSPTAASYAFGFIGLFNIAGAYLFGALGDRYSKKSVLTLIYLLRAVLMTAILFMPLTDLSAIILCACMGLVWLSTVPLTSGIVAQIFGPAHFSFLFGIVFMSHQIGGFTGAWLGGRIFDATGSYDQMWMISIALGVMSAALHWPISDKPLERLRRSAIA
ncbi:MAG: MFS transporter [Pseudomonadota bacterium]